MTAPRDRPPRSAGRCPLCRGPITTRHRVTRVAGKGWAHSDCARRKASTT